MLLKIIRTVFALVFRLIATVEVQGQEHIPRQGGGIVALNHLGFMDAPLLLVLVPRADFTALVAKKHQKNFFLRWLVNTVGGIWLNREEADSQAVRAATSHLKKGGLLGLAPEGTRSKTGSLLKAKTGIAFLADKAQVPVYPVALHGTYRGFHKLARFKRPHVVVRFGPPFYLEPLERSRRDEILERNTNEIMTRIAVMLPPEVHGAYAGHPRIRELAEEQNLSWQPAASGSKQA
jgi:1-acyl-sn-glycerol-3-phosphate acyltransferase